MCVSAALASFVNVLNTDHLAIVQTNTPMLIMQVRFVPTTVDAPLVSMIMETPPSCYARDADCRGGNDRGRYLRPRQIPPPRHSIFNNRIATHS